MSATALQVEQELVAISLRTQPRGLLNGLAFAALTAALVWPRLPHPFLFGWLAGFAVLAFARWEISRAFQRAPSPVPDPRRWARRAAFGYGGTGLAWAVMFCACLVMAPDVPLYPMWVAFLVVLFAVLSAQTTAAHPLVFNTFVLCAAVPGLVVSILTPAPNWILRLAAETLLFTMAMLVGRSGNRYVVDSIRMRYENVELLRDVERQKDELDRANAAKTRFLAAASHDLRQPMQALVLLVESLKERVRQPENQRLAEGIHATVESMSSLLNEILDISRLDAGTVSPQRTSFPVANVLDRLRAAYTLTAARKDLTFRVRDDPCIVRTDPVLLYRILVNLVENALRYTNHGGVLVACRRRADGAWIEVWDTGVGIPADQHEAIFQEFHQLRNPHRDRGQGFGLGLAIVQRTARLLDLELQLRSRVGHGSVFRVRVPYGEASEVQRPEPAPRVEALEGLRVAVLEDDAEIREAMRVLLDGWGCEVYVASDPRELDALIKRMPASPQVLIADYRVPGGENGLEVVQRMRRRRPDMAAILVSGDVAPTVLKAAQEAEVELLHKPLRPARLRALLQSLHEKAAVA